MTGRPLALFVAVALLSAPAYVLAAAAAEMVKDDPLDAPLVNWNSRAPWATLEVLTTTRPAPAIGDDHK